MNIEEKSDKITKEIIEMDELYCYTENKKRTYLITFGTKKTRQIVNFSVALDKNLERIQKMADDAPKAKFYYSDG